LTAIYQGLQFDTKLEAQWAAFFDLASWQWRTNPAPLGNWKPEFRVDFPCNHSKCGGSHGLLVAILPVDSIADAGEHPTLSQRYNLSGEGSQHHKGVQAGAVFGNTPSVSQFEFGHGSGGGVFEVDSWVHNANELWRKAALMVS
jgi:hypothetical protein